MTGKRSGHPATKTSKPKRRKDEKAPGSGEAQLAPGSGFVALARHAGQVVSINAQAVHRNDHFEYAYGLNERLEHVPAAVDRGEITHFYAYVKFKDGSHHFDVMPRAEVEAARGTGYAELGKRAVLRRLARFLDELGEILSESPEPAAPATPAAVSEPRRPSIPEIEPQGVELSEEEFFAILPPSHILHILDAVAERDMPEKVLEEIVGKPLDDVTEEEEADILRAISLWQPDSHGS